MLDQFAREIASCFPALRPLLVQPLLQPSQWLKPFPIGLANLPFAYHPNMPFTRHRDLLLPFLGKLEIDVDLAYVFSLSRRRVLIDGDRLA